MEMRKGIEAVMESVKSAIAGAGYESMHSTYIDNRKSKSHYHIGADISTDDKQVCITVKLYTDGRNQFLSGYLFIEELTCKDGEVSSKEIQKIETSSLNVLLSNVK